MLPLIYGVNSEDYQVTSLELLIPFHLPRGKHIGNRIHPHICHYCCFFGGNLNKKETAVYNMLNLHPLSISWYLKSRQGHILAETMSPLFISRVFEYLKWLVVKFVSIKISLKIENQEKSLFKLQIYTSAD